MLDTNTPWLGFERTAPGSQKWSGTFSAESTCLITFYSTIFGFWTFLGQNSTQTLKIRKAVSPRKFSALAPFPVKERATLRSATITVCMYSVGRLRTSRKTLQTTFTFWIWIPTFGQPTIRKPTIFLLEVRCAAPGSTQTPYFSSGGWKTDLTRVSMI